MNLIERCSSQLIALTHVAPALTGYNSYQNHDFQKQNNHPAEPCQEDSQKISNHDAVNQHGQTLINWPTSACMMVRKVEGRNMTQLENQNLNNNELLIWRLHVGDKDYLIDLTALGRSKIHRRLKKQPCQKDVIWSLSQRRSQILNS